VIFSSGNGVCAVDNGWFERLVAGEFLDLSVMFCPPEEMIWLNHLSWSGNAMMELMSFIFCASAPRISIGVGYWLGSANIGARSSVI
jgi:hypothetical protein